MLESRFFVSSHSLLSSSCCSSEEKERVLEIITEMIREEIVKKGGNGDKVIKELIYIAEEIEKDGEKKKEMKKAGDAATLFLKGAKSNGWNVREERERKKSIEENEEEVERLKKEKEEANRKVDVIEKEKEEAIRIKEAAVKEKEELKRELEKERSKNSNSLEQILDHLKILPTDSLFYLPLIFSDNKKMKREGNLIIHYESEGKECCIFDKEMKKVNFNIFIFFFVYFLIL